METQNLTEEEINRKVAELMGWVWFESHNQHGYWQYPSDRTRDLWSCNMHRFSTSMDACATFEAAITEKVSQVDYAQEIVNIINAERHGEH